MERVFHPTVKYYSQTSMFERSPLTKCPEEKDVQNQAQSAIQLKGDLQVSYLN